MPFVIVVDVIPEGGGDVDVTHVFWGDSESECRRKYDAHAKGCEFLTPAIADDRVEEETFDLEDGGEYEEFVERMSERPKYDEEAEEEAEEEEEEPEESEEK